MNAEELGREPKNHYGSLEPALRMMRAHRPLDLNSKRWHKAHPEGSFEQWRNLARQCLQDGLHYDPGPLDLKPQMLDRSETKSFTRERIEFNTAPWFRVPGYFYTPKNTQLPAPGLVVMHEVGGPFFFGSERVCGDPDHPLLVEHRIGAGGRAVADFFKSGVHDGNDGCGLADFFAARGYCVLTIDAYHFGRRAPRGISGLPDTYDPWKMTWMELANCQDNLKASLYYGVRQLNWAGTTWCGVNFGDDSRCIDYLESRPEVDASRIGVTGLSGGGWRTNILAALDDRVRAAVPVGWMTTGDTQQAYDFNNAIGTFCLLPGVWDRIDVPDLIAMAAPKACMVVSGAKDLLFPPAGQRDAADQIAAAYRWAGCEDKFNNYAPDKPHCYDAEIREQALLWFDRFLEVERTCQ